LLLSRLGPPACLLGIKISTKPANADGGLVRDGRGEKLKVQQPTTKCICRSLSAAGEPANPDESAHYLLAFADFALHRLQFMET
jgi:hypothetical protein